MNNKDDKFTDAHIENLRKEYDNLKTMDPESATYVKLIKLLDSLPQTHLKQLAQANIKFISMLAKNRVKK